MKLNFSRTQESLTRSTSKQVHGGYKQRGQGMTEYIIIVALIAVAAIATYRFFGKTVRNQTAGIAQEVAGQSATTAITNAETSANSAQTQANQNKGLDNYDN